MAFAFTCYGNDESIASTSIYATGINESYTVPYGETLNLGGFPDSVRFTANPSTDCGFVRWVYRLGSTTGTVQYSYSNPFTYSGDEDIFIRAEGEYDGTGGGGGTEDTWVLKKNSLGPIYSDTSVTITLGQYELHRYAVSFANSGYATFYTTGSVDTFGVISTSDGWIANSGIPDQLLASNDDGNDHNFSISYYVTSGTPYYVWVRSASGTETGITQLHVTVPSGYNTWTIKETNIPTLLSGNSWKVNYTGTGYTVFRISVTFLNEGIASFSGSMGSGGMICYLSTSPNWDYQNGEPDNYLISSTNNTTDVFSEPSFTYNVTTGTKYYFWVRRETITSVTDNSTGSANLLAPIVSKPSKWDWQASNGSATAIQTSAAYNAVVNRTAVKNFSHLVWNDLVNSWAEVLMFKRIRANEYAIQYNTALMPKYYNNSDGTTRVDYTLTAEVFNSLLFLVRKVYSVGISDVSPGNVVLGSYFTTLATYLNNCIDTL